MQINGHKISLTLVISCLVALGSLLTWVGSVASDNADVKRRVLSLEDRVKEDRRELKETNREMKADLKDTNARVKDTNDIVHKILGKLEAAEQRNKPRGGGNER